MHSIVDNENSLYYNRNNSMKRNIQNKRDSRSSECPVYNLLQQNSKDKITKKNDHKEVTTNKQKRKRKKRFDPYELLKVFGTRPPIEWRGFSVPVSQKEELSFAENEKVQNQKKETQHSYCNEEESSSSSNPSSSSSSSSSKKFLFMTSRIGGGHTRTPYKPNFIKDPLLHSQTNTNPSPSTFDFANVFFGNQMGEDEKEKKDNNMFHDMDTKDFIYCRNHHENDYLYQNQETQEEYSVPIDNVPEYFETEKLEPVEETKHVVFPKWINCSSRKQNRSNSLFYFTGGRISSEDQQKNTNNVMIRDKFDGILKNRRKKTKNYNGYNNFSRLNSIREEFYQLPRKNNTKNIKNKNEDNNNEEKEEVYENDRRKKSFSSFRTFGTPTTFTSNLQHSINRNISKQQKLPKTQKYRFISKENTTNFSTIRTKTNHNQNFDSEVPVQNNINDKNNTKTNNINYDKPLIKKDQKEDKKSAIYEHENEWIENTKNNLKSFSDKDKSENHTTDNLPYRAQCLSISFLLN